MKLKKKLVFILTFIVVLFPFINGDSKAYSTESLMATALHRCETNEKSSKDIKRCQCGIISFFIVLGEDRTKEGKMFLRTAASNIPDAINYFISQTNDIKLQMADIYLAKCMNSD